MQTSLRSRETHSAPPQRAGRWEHKPSERAPSLREQGFFTFVLIRHCGAGFLYLSEGIKAERLRLSISAMTVIPVTVSTGLVTASTGLVTASTGPSAEEDLSIPSRREKRNETLRVSDLMSLRGTAARGTISGRRPPVRVPWPYSITVQLVPESKSDCASHVLARSLFVQLNPCTEQVPWAPPAFQARIGHRDAQF